MSNVNIEKVKKSLAKRNIEYVFEEYQGMPIFVMRSGITVSINRMDTVISVRMYHMLEAEFKNDDELTMVEISKALRKVKALHKRYGAH